MWCYSVYPVQYVISYVSFESGRKVVCDMTGSISKWREGERKEDRKKEKSPSFLLRVVFFFEGRKTIWFKAKRNFPFKNVLAFSYISLKYKIVDSVYGECMKFPHFHSFLHSSSVTREGRTEDLSIITSFLPLMKHYAFLLWSWIFVICQSCYLLHTETFLLKIPIVPSFMPDLCKLNMHMWLWKYIQLSVATRKVKNVY